MVSEATSEEIFRKLKEAPENNLCIDCKAENPDWACITHGAFICLSCATIHRRLGVHISFVRSLTLDTWSVK